MCELSHNLRIKPEFSFFFFFFTDTGYFSMFAFYQTAYHADTKRYPV